MKKITVEAQQNLQVTIGTNARVDGPLLGISEQMFVHNNSKHGRRTKRADPADSSLLAHRLEASRLMLVVLQRR